MKKLYLMRHGETRFNVMGLTQGVCDSPLTYRGIEQAKAARAFFDRKDVQVDHWFCSPLGRAVQTLEVLTNNQVPYERVEGVREQDMGENEGRDRRLQPDVPFGDYFLTRGGESDAQVIARVNEALVNIMERPDVEQAFVVSHGLIYLLFTFYSPLVEVKTNITATADPPNGAILTFEYEDRHFSLVDLFVPDCEQSHWIVEGASQL